MPPAGFGPIVDGDGNPVYQMDEYGNVIYPDAQPNLPELPPEPVSRFTRQGLDPTGQKLYDQLAQQKQLLGENASQLYRPTSFINEDEQLALMAANLARTGITDIYKVKQTTAPTYLDTQYDEGGQLWYVDSSNNQWYPYNDSSLKFDDTGAYITKNQYVNTETGQPLNVSATNVFNNDSRILASEGTGGRTTAGFGIEFLESGVPVYFATGYDAPRKRNFWDFVKGVLPLAVAFIPGIGQLFAPMASSILGVGASQAAVAALSQGIAAGIAGTVATGDIEKGILSGLTSGILNYGGGIASGLDEVAYVPPTSASQLAAIGTGALPGMDDLAWMDTVNPAQIAAIGTGELPTGIEQLVTTQIPTDVVPPSITEAVSPVITEAAAPQFDIPTEAPSTLGDPTAAYGGIPELLGPADLGDPTAVAGGMPEQVGVTELGDPTAGFGGMPDEGIDPTLGDPTAGYGGMPKQAMTPEEVAAAFKEGAIGDPYIAAELATGTPMTPEQVAEAFKSGSISDPYIASDMATGGPMTPAEVADALKSGAIGDPYIANEMAGATAMGTSTTPTLDIFKQILANPVGRTIVGQLLAGGIGGAGGVLNLLGGSGATAPGGIAGLAQQQAPQIYYADIPEFDVTKEFSPTLYAMREGRV